MTKPKTTVLPYKLLTLLLLLLNPKQSSSQNTNDDDTISPTLYPSPPLTPSELAILNTISHLPSESPTEDPHGLLQPIETKLHTLQNELTSLQDYQEETFETVLSIRTFEELYDRYKQLEYRTATFLGYGSSSSSSSSSRTDEENEDHDGDSSSSIGIGSYNTRQLRILEQRLEKLMGLVDDQNGELDTALDLLKRDEDYDYIYEEDEESKEEESPTASMDSDQTDHEDAQINSIPETTTDHNEEDDDDENEQPVTYNELQTSLRWHHLLTHLQTHTQSILSNRLTSALTTATALEQQSYRASVRTLEQGLERAIREVKDVGTCVNVTEAAAVVLESLVVEEEEVRTGGWGSIRSVERYDHLKDAVVVYGGEWTSGTYKPLGSTPSRRKEEEERRRKRDEWTLDGIVPSIRSYVPQDWERFLPDGWDTYDFSYLVDYVHPLYLTERIRSLVPLYVWHSLPRFLGGSSSRSGNSGSTTTNNIVPPSPETAIHPNTHLGSCWPVQHQERGIDDGVLTLRLRYPLESVEGLTIEHAAGTVSRVDKSSAPRNVVVVGYPVCEEEDGDDEDGDVECRRMGFDAANPVELGSFEYKVVPRLEKGSGEKEEGWEYDEPWPTRSVQTFRIGSSRTSNRNPIRTKLMQERVNSYSTVTPEDREEEEEEEDHGMSTSSGFGAPSVDAVAPGSCTISSCTKPPPVEEAVDDYNRSEKSRRSEKRAIAAVKIRIIDNWGNPDFTCLYRVRLHGWSKSEL